MQANNHYPFFYRRERLIPFKDLLVKQSMMANLILEKAEEELQALLYDETGIVGQITEKVEKRVGLRREHISYISMAALGVYLVYGYAAGVVCNMIGFVYPFYVSIKGIKCNDAEENSQWMTYWIVFALFGFADLHSGKMMEYAPVYWLIKCLILLWLFLPFTRGAQTLYKDIILPELLQLSYYKIEVQEEAVEPCPEAIQSQVSTESWESNEVLRAIVHDPFMQLPYEADKAAGAHV